MGATLQVIPFAQTADLAFGDAAVALSATSDSGLPITVAKAVGPGSVRLDTSGPARVWRHTPPSSAP